MNLVVLHSWFQFSLGVYVSVRVSVVWLTRLGSLVALVHLSKLGSHLGICNQRAI